MRKEPIALYIFRFLMGFGLFAFMCMLYWSSTLIEGDMKEVQRELASIASQISALTTDVKKGESKEQEAALKVPRPHIDPNLPNLLQDDPFYLKTLPKLLGPNFHPYGNLRSTTVGKPVNLNIFNNWSDVSTWNRLCSDTLANNLFGKYETLAPAMAIKIEARKNEKRGVEEFWVHLREGLFWEPLKPEFFTPDIVLAPQFLKKQPVTSKDFKFYYDAVMNPHNQEIGAISMRTYIGDIGEIEIIDPLTFIVRWKAEIDSEGVPRIKYAARFLTGGLPPLACFVFQYYPDGSKIVENDSDPETYRKDSVWAQQFSEHWAKNVIVSCGSWVFDGFNERSIKFRRNDNFYSPYLALTEKREYVFKETLEALWQDFKTMQSDYYTLQPNQELELENFLKSSQYEKQKEQGAAILRLDYLSRRYTYIGWNMAGPLFSSTKVRRAMTMAIDRARIIKQNLNGNGVEITGSFSQNSPSNNQSIEPWPFDPAAARLLLEEEGWYDSDGDGVIDKVIDGEVTPFRFRLTYFVKSSTGKSICEYISSALREIGVDCQLNGVDITDLSLMFDDKSFDAYMLSWVLGSPPENPRQLWYSTGAKQKGSSNAVGFANEEADKIIDRLEYETNYEKRLELYHRFHEILHEQQPYTFLFAPKTVLLYRSYIQNLFLPSERQDLIPGANVEEPDWSAAWIKPREV